MDGIVGSATFRPSPPWSAVWRRWCWLPVLAVGTVLYELVRETLLVTGDPLFVPTLILLGAAVVPVAFVAFVSGLRLPFGVGAWTVGLTRALSTQAIVPITFTFERAGSVTIQDVPVATTRGQE